MSDIRGGYLGAEKQLRSQGMDGSPVETRADAAFIALRGDIISGVRAPGERLRIERLKEIYGIGPTPLREALQRLCAEGLVIASGNRGFMVAPLDPDEFADLNAARIEIEKSALRLSLARGDDEWDVGVAAAAWRIRRADVALREGGADIDSWEKANAAFHEALVAACRSRWLLRVRGLLNDQYARFRRASVGLNRVDRDLAAEHAAIAEAALARDADRLCALTEAHFHATEAALAEGAKP
jgi:DNA-binding GntR family transcriptional regulator